MNFKIFHPWIWRRALLGAVLCLYFSAVRGQVPKTASPDACDICESTTWQAAAPPVISDLDTRDGGICHQEFRLNFTGVPAPVNLNCPSHGDKRCLPEFSSITFTFDVMPPSNTLFTDDAGHELDWSAVPGAPEVKLLVSSHSDHLGAVTMQIPDGDDDLVGEGCPQLLEVLGGGLCIIANVDMSDEPEDLFANIIYSPADFTGEDGGIIPAGRPGYQIGISSQLVRGLRWEVHGSWRPMDLYVPAPVDLADALRSEWETGLQAASGHQLALETGLAIRFQTGKWTLDGTLYVGVSRLNWAADSLQLTDPVRGPLEVAHWDPRGSIQFFRGGVRLRRRLAGPISGFAGAHYQASAGQGFRVEQRPVAGAVDPDTKELDFRALEGSDFFPKSLPSRSFMISLGLGYSFGAPPCP